MLIGLLRRVAVVLIGLAFLGGATLQAMPPSDVLSASARDVTAAMDDCAHMAMQQAEHSGPAKPMPCKGVTPDCIKLMNCIGLPSLPGRVGQVFAPVEYGVVAYWSGPSLGDGLTVEPNLLPPISA